MEGALPGAPIPACHMQGQGGDGVNEDESMGKMGTMGVIGMMGTMGMMGTAGIQGSRPRG